MLFSKPTKRGVGLMLYGDYSDLRSLHETMHVLCGHRNGTYHNQREQALWIAYELRKAYEGQRETARIDETGNTYFSANFAWPSLLFYASHFRQLAGLLPTDKEHQANLYRLEHCIESALLQYDQKIGSEVIGRYSSIGFVSQDFLFSFVEEVSRQYIYDGGTGKLRFKRLPQLLRTICVWSDEYKEFLAHMAKRSAESNCSVADLHDMRQWPEFKW